MSDSLEGFFIYRIDWYYISMGIFKNRTDIQNLRQAAIIAGTVCEQLIDAAKPGITTMELENLANRLLQLNRATAPFKQFNGFGYATCISINEEIVNAPPSLDRQLKEGDLVSIAIGSCFKGFHGKAARTVYLGDASFEVDRLLEGTKVVISNAIEYSKQAVMLIEILERAVQIAEQYQLTIIRNTGGCGIGKQLHEAPLVPNHPEEFAGSVMLVPGFAFTLMPMMSLGQADEFTIQPDGWTHVTADNSLSAHFADTMLMTDEGLIALSQAYML